MHKPWNLNGNETLLSFLGTTKKKLISFLKETM